MRFSVLKLIAFAALASPLCAEPTVVPGVTEPFFDVVLSSSVQGTIANQHFKEGAEVKSGEVILDLDSPDCPHIAQRISTTFPAIKVITCSSDEPVMRVFPAFHHGESYEAGLTLQALAAAIQS